MGVGNGMRCIVALFSALCVCRREKGEWLEVAGTFINCSKSRDTWIESLLLSGITACCGECREKQKPLP